MIYSIWIFLVAYAYGRNVRVANSTIQSSIERFDILRPSVEVEEALQRRKLQSAYEATPLDMNCGDMTGYPCQLYMQKFLKTFVYVNDSYDRLTLPVANKADAPLDIDVIITFVDLVNVDTVSGTMTASIFIDYLWKDAFMSWNSSLTDDDGFLVVPLDLLWIADIQLYNSIGGYFKQLDSSAVFLMSSGTVWWSGRGVNTFSCTFDIQSFPFDSQVCTAEFSSWSYSINNINISYVGASVLSTFNNLAWNVNSVSARRVVAPWGVDYIHTIAAYDISITRYYNYYISSAILPAIIITSVVLSSLWMGDQFGTRLSLGVTGLLTMSAIQWSVASELPVAQSSNWLGRFLLLCTMFIAGSCVVCYLSSIMYAQKHTTNIPLWGKYLIDVSLLDNIFSKARTCDRQLRDDNKETTELRGEIELSTAAAKEDGETGEIRSNSCNPMVGHHGELQAAQAQHRSPVAQEDEKYTWIRASRALDRVAKIMLPLLFFIILAVQLAPQL